MSAPGIFVDKDGTLVENVPYNVDPDLLKFKPGALRALAALAARGFAIVVVTNQSGVARGYFTRTQLTRLRDALARRLAEEAGVRLKGFHFCPHEPDAHGRPTCSCRKPRPGMLLEASRMHGIDLERSWMIGDTLDDVEAGRRAGCRTIFYDSGGETRWRMAPLRYPWSLTTDWWDAARLILAQAMHR
ncbi:HAD family hydrolase [Comamonas sp. NLF-1-9]|nr:HAD family hydrolase [Comamonas sp. NLF-1-9]